MANKGILEVIDMLNEYSKDIQNGITEKAQEIAKQGQKTLKQTSPKRKSKGGKYARGWRVNVEKGTWTVNCTIYNATSYQLTHLLENTHNTRNGGAYNPVISGTVHIAPVEETCVKEYELGVEKVIKDGG